MCRGRELNTNFFFSSFSGTAGISRQNTGISHQKSLISLVSRDMPNFLAPTPSRGRLLPHRKISGLKEFGFALLFRTCVESLIPFVRIHSGNNSKIIFLCICICNEIKIMSKIIFICYVPPPPQNCKEQLRLYLLRKINSKRIFVCICICYEMHN